MNEHHVLINPDRCIGCNLCAKTCAANNIELKNKKAKIISMDCIICGQCTAVCLKEAISISGYDTSQIKNRSDAHLDPHEVLDVIRFRRSIRQFQNQPIPKEVLNQILEAGRLTHTAKNMQALHLVRNLLSDTCKKEYDNGL